MGDVEGEKEGEEEGRSLRLMECVVASPGRPSGGGWVEAAEDKGGRKERGSGEIYALRCSFLSTSEVTGNMSIYHCRERRKARRCKTRSFVIWRE